MPNLTICYKVSGRVITSAGSVDPFGTGDFDCLEIDISVTALTGTISFSYCRLDPYGNSYPLWTGALAANGVLIADIGPGLSIPLQPGQSGQLSWAVTGSGATATVAVLVQGK